MNAVASESRIAPDQHFSCHVRCSSPLSQHLVRLVLGGPGLAGFASTGAHDEWIRVYPPRPGEAELPLPRRSGDGWAWDGEQPACRYYTVRDWDAASGELTVDVVVHDAGLVTGWAQQAQPGDQLVVCGPRGSFAPPDKPEWVWLVGDLTALPAIGRIVENLPAGLAARALVEVPGPSDRIPLVSRADLVVTWVEHERTPANVSVLEREVRDSEWPEGNGYFWMAGEASQMRGLRKYLRHDRRLATPAYDVMGYWRFDSARWERRYEAASIDALALWEEGERLGLDSAEIWDRYDQALTRVGL